MSFRALGVIVQWLDNHHLLGLSQREFKHAEEELSKVIFKVPFFTWKFQTSRRKAVL